MSLNCFSKFLIVWLCLIPMSNLLLAQSDIDKVRIKRIRDFPRWKKEPLSKKEFQRCMKDLQSGIVATVKDALEKLALAKPDSALSRQVIAAARYFKKQFPDDDFYRSVYFYLCESWEGAERAAATLQEAKSRGGFKYLERMMRQGNGLEKRRGATTLMWVETPEAAELLVSCYDSDKLAIVGALKGMGPVAVPATMKLFESPEWPKRVSAAQILKEIATAKDVPLLEKQLATEKKSIVRLELKQAIAAAEDGED